MLALAVGLVACVPLVAAQDCLPSYRAPCYEHAGYQGRLALADCNGNGRVDLVATFPFQTLACFLDIGGLRLPPPVLSAFSIVGGPVATGNFDGDGFDDAVTADASAYPPRLRFFHSVGDGSFTQPAPALPMPVCKELAAGDLDGDGDDDLLFVTADSSLVQTLSNSGSGVFAVSASIWLHGENLGGKLADLDHDGDLDIAALTRTTGAVYRNDGSGQFHVAAHFPVGTGYVTSVVLADFDGDGALDWANLDASPHAVEIRFGDGNCGFGPTTLIANVGGPNLLRAGDVDVDGRDDLILGTTPDDWLILRGLAGGGFSNAVRRPAPGFMLDSVLADVDADGDPDMLSLFVFNSSCAVVLQENRGGLYESHERHILANQPLALDVGDVDASGVADFAVATFDGVEVLRSGSSDFTHYLSGAQLQVKFAAVDHDSALDVLAVSGTGAFSVLRGVSGADPTPVSINPISSLITDMDTGDFDSDGNVDVVLASAGSQVIVLLGDGSFGFSAGAPVAVANGVMRVRSLDFDLDGRLDLATQSNLSDSITLLRGDGAGGLTVHSSFVAGSSTTVPEVGDLDGDGRVDLALIASGAIATWRGTSNGFQPMWSTPSNSARWLRLADIDADGVLDIAAVPINVTSALRLYFGAGDGSFGPPEFYADACANPSVCATDTDGDGRVDIVLAGYTNHRYSIAPALMILRRRGDLPASYCGEAPNPAGCRGSLTVHGCPTLGQSSGFAVNVGGVGNHRAALLVYGYERAVAPFHGERLCIAEPRHRTGIIDTGGNTGTDDCSGSFAFDFASYASTGADPALVSGAVVCCQAVVRDPGAPGHVGVTNALEFTLLP